MSFEKKSKTSYSTDTKVRRSVAILSTIVIGILLSLVIANCSLNVVVNYYQEDMVQGLKDVVRQYKDDINRDRLYEESINETAENLSGFVLTVFTDRGVSPETIEYVDSFVSDYMNYYLFYGNLNDDTKQAEGFFLYQENRQQLKGLSKEELYDIMSAKNVAYDDGYRIFTYEMNPGQYLLVRFKSTEIFTKKSALEAYSEDSDELICRIDESTGLIEDSNEQSFIGENIENYQYYDTLDKLRELEAYVPKIMINSNNQAVVMAGSEEINGKMFVSVIPTNILLPAAIRNSVMGIVLCLVFLVIILVYVLKFLNNIEDDEKSVKFVPITKKLCLDVHFLSHVGGLTVFATVLTVVSMLYVQTMTNYSTQNEKARVDLKGLEQHIELSMANSKSMEEDYFANARSVMDILSAYYTAFPEECTEESIRRMLDNLPSIDRIAIYDEQGVSEYDSDGITGVALTRDELAGESNFWKVLNKSSSLEYFVTEKNDESFYTIAVLRQDSKGLFVVRQNGNVFDEFKDDAFIQNSILTANMGDSERGYIEKNNPEFLYWRKEGSGVFKEVPNNLSDTVQSNGYSGIARISNKRELVNTRDTDERILLCGKSTLELFGIQTLIEYILVIILLWLQYFVLVSLGIRKRKSIEDDEVNVMGERLSYAEILRDRTMDKVYRRTIVWMLMCALFMIVVTLLVDSGFGNVSILSYLFGSKWTKGINLFSITMIMMMISCVVIISKAIEILIVFITKNMGPRGVTIGRMFCSLIKFIALVVVLVMTLVDLGADLKALLASAGIAGAMISFCAQQTVNDLLSGFFMIFENSINVGDWIEVDGFRGEVIEIGVRITKISAGGTTKLVNNSDLRNMSKLCNEKSGAYCEFEIAYKEDAKKVLDLLNGKANYFREQISQIEDGPYFEGVLDLGASGVMLRMWAKGHRDFAMKIERELRRITKEILDENGVEIPFNQVTVHMNDEK